MHSTWNILDLTSSSTAESVKAHGISRALAENMSCGGGIVVYNEKHQIF